MKNGPWPGPLAQSTWERKCSVSDFVLRKAWPTVHCLVLRGWQDQGSGRDHSRSSGYCLFFVSSHNQLAALALQYCSQELHHTDFGSDIVMKRKQCSKISLQIWDLLLLMWHQETQITPLSIDHWLNL